MYTNKERSWEILHQLKNFFCKDCHFDESEIHDLTHGKILSKAIKNRYEGLRLTENTPAYELARISKSLDITHDELVRFFSDIHIPVGKKFIKKTEEFFDRFEEQKLIETMFR